MNRIQVKRNVHLFLKEPTLTFDMLLLKNQNKKTQLYSVSQLALQPAYYTGKNILNSSDQKFET